MDIKKIQKGRVKTLPITIRITPEESAYMKKNRIAPSLLFREALKDLMEEE